MVPGLPSITFLTSPEIYKLKQVQQVIKVSSQTWHEHHTDIIQVCVVKLNTALGAAFSRMCVGATDSV